MKKLVITATPLKLPQVWAEPNQHNTSRKYSLETKQNRIHATIPVFHNFRGQVCG